MGERLAKFDEATPQTAEDIIPVSFAERVLLRKAGKVAALAAAAVVGANAYNLAGQPGMQSAIDKVSGLFGGDEKKSGIIIQHQEEFPASIPQEIYLQLNKSGE